MLYKYCNNESESEENSLPNVLATKEEKEQLCEKIISFEQLTK